MAQSQDHFRPWKRCRRRYLPTVFPIIIVISSMFLSTANANTTLEAGETLLVISESEDAISANFSHHEAPEIHPLEIPVCVPPAIAEFPEDFFTQEQRQAGGIAVHFAFTLYLCCILGLICDKYFVPSLELVSEILHVPTDVAGATFMAIGTSAPELFSSVIGSFITEGDIGVGAIVGSAVFNVIGITGLAGLAVWKMDVPIDWYPISRDCFAYTLSIIALIAILHDNTVVWYEAVILLVMFVLYVIMMVYNSQLEYFSESKFDALKAKFSRRGSLSSLESSGEKTPLLQPREVDIEAALNKKKKSVSFANQMGSSQEFVYHYDAISSESYSSEKQKEENSEDGKIDEEMDSIWSIPKKGVLKKIFWIVMWPACFLMYLTIPDCRKAKWRPYFLLTFAMAVAWIAGMTYLSVWMVTVIGYTFNIPDSIAGITLLAVGTSVPEIISSILVIRNGLGNMAICNLVGSNVFNIVFCLGAPWLIKTTLMSNDGTIHINSPALTYMTITLLSTVVLLYIIFIVTKWKINRKVGFMCLLMYLGFILLACYYELELLAGVGLPTCLM